MPSVAAENTTSPINEGFHEGAIHVTPALFKFNETSCPINNIARIRLVARNGLFIYACAAFIAVLAWFCQPTALSITVFVVALSIACVGYNEKSSLEVSTSGGDVLVVHSKDIGLLRRIKGAIENAVENAVEKKGVN